MKKSISAFLEHLGRENNYSANTLSAYHNDLNQLLAFSEAAGATSWGDDILCGYLLDLKRKSYSPATTARKVASAKSFFKFLANSGRIEENPAKNLVSPKVNKQIPKLLSTSEYRLLLNEPTKLDTPEAKRDVVMLELLYATGLRVGELVALVVNNIDLEKSCIYLTHRNTRRHVSIDYDISLKLKNYLGNDRLDLLYDEKEQALFLNRRGGRLTRQGFWQIVKNYTARAGLATKVTPHTLRHSFATRKLQSGMDLQAVQKALGHAYISSTRIYKQHTLKQVENV